MNRFLKKNALILVIIALCVILVTVVLVKINKKEYFVQEGEEEKEAEDEQVTLTPTLFSPHSRYWSHTLLNSPHTQRTVPTTTNQCINLTVRQAQSRLQNNRCNGNISLSPNVTSIGPRAFQDLGLRRITIPSSVRSIGESAFESNTNLESITFGAGSQLTSIGIRAFAINTSLTSITIPDSVKIIGEGAFVYNTNLQSIIIPSSVISIGDVAFADNTNLKSITIPNSVKNSIGRDAFLYTPIVRCVTSWQNANTNQDLIINNNVCPSFTTTQRTVPTTHARTTPLPTIAPTTTTTNQCINLTVRQAQFRLQNTRCNGNISLSPNVTSIGQDAFANWPYLRRSTWRLRTIRIPNTVISIGDYAFYRSGLISINLPNNLTQINDSVFSNCHNLTSVTFRAQSQVTRIGNSAFNTCMSLTSINIPSSVISIGEFAFYGCRLLTSVTLPLNTHYLSRSFDRRYTTVTGGRLTT